MTRLPGHKLKGLRVRLQIYNSKSRLKASELKWVNSDSIDMELTRLSSDVSNYFLYNSNK